MRKTISGVAAAGALAAAALAPEASAHQAPEPDTQWHSYRSDDISYDAGERCSFAVKGHVTKDREEYRDVNFWPDDSVRTQLFRGPLFIRWTNRVTGRSVLRNQSGRAILAYRRNGDLASLTARTGHFSAGAAAGSVPGKGLYYLGGEWTSVQINQDGTITVSLGPDGTSENLCRTLAS